MVEVQRIIEDIENGMVVPHSWMLRLIQYVRELQNEREANLRGKPFLDAGVQSLQETVSGALSWQKPPLWEYRFFRQAHKDWKEIEGMMNGMAQNDWELVNQTFVEGVRAHFWYFTWKKRIS